MPAQLRPITLVLEVSPELHEDLAAPEGLIPEAERRITERITKVFAALGVPGAGLGTLRGASSAIDRSFRVRINEIVAHFSDDLLSRIQHRVEHVLGHASTTEANAVAGLRALARRAGNNGESRAGVVDFLATFAESVLTLHPALLLAPEQVRLWLEQALAAVPPSNNLQTDVRVAVPESDVAWLLRELLALRLSIADAGGIWKKIQAVLADGRSLEEAAERIAAELAPGTVKIRMSPGLLRELSSDDGGRDKGIFGILRDDLFYESGVTYPDFSFVLDRDLKANTVRFVINHLPSPPWSLLQKDEVLAGKSPDALERAGIPYIRAACNPLSGTLAAVISESNRAEAERLGARTWSGMEYVVLLLTTELRRHAGVLLLAPEVDNMLTSLKQVFPALVEKATQLYSLATLTRGLRLLVAEGISIRNMRALLESIVDLDFIAADEDSVIIFDDRLAFAKPPPRGWRNDPSNLATTMRIALKRYINYKYARGRNAMSVLLLDRQLERRLATLSGSNDAMSEAEHAALLEAVRTILRSFDPEDFPAILTVAGARLACRKALAGEYPMLPVLTYQELSPEMNIQPIARIRPEAEAIAIIES